MSQKQLPLDVNEWHTWDDRSKAKFLEGLKQEQAEKIIWFCKRGRTCDGKPHKGAPNKHARGDQWPPPGLEWVYWVLKGGRGSGKTRSGSEWTRVMSDKVPITSIIGPTTAHVREFMVEGNPSGILASFRRVGIAALWEPTKHKITLPNGHIIRTFSGEEPDRLRGPEHGAVWLDEPAHIALIKEVWTQMKFGLRLGERPLVLCTTTPLPTEWMKAVLADPKTVAVTVSTYANIDNLAPNFAEEIISEYEGTRRGRQEIHGEVLEDIEGALWTTELIDPYRMNGVYSHEDMDRIVVGIDPAGTSTKKRDQTGIVVVGRKGSHFYVLADSSGHFTPDGWAKAAWRAYDLYQADMIVAEKNYGGEMVLSTLRNERENGRTELVWSRRGKELRAEPVVGLYEQGRVHHMADLTDLETQLTTWVPDQSPSPDRIDALVHAMTELSGQGGQTSVAAPGAAPLAVKGSSAGATSVPLFGLPGYAGESYEAYGPGSLLLPAGGGMANLFGR